MSTRTDHAAEADANLATVADVLQESGRVSITDTIAIAQAQATLALVEQQRISNLIALSCGSYANGQPWPDRLHHPTDEFSVALNDDVKEGLGLS